jgi:tetratricopeptide (TPR) repeat protein
MAKALLGDGDLKGALAEMRDMIASNNFGAVESLITEYLPKFRSTQNKLGEGHMLLAQAELALAKLDPDEALKQALVCKERELQLDTAALHVIIEAYLLMDKAGEAKLAAKELLNTLRGDVAKRMDPEEMARGYLALANAYLAMDPENMKPLEAIEAVEKAKAIYVNTKSTKGQAKALVAGARACVASEKAQAALDEVKEALGLSRTAGDTKGMVEALEVTVQAYAIRSNPVAGLAAANKELAELKKAGNKKGEADILQMIANTHATLGEPVGALKAATAALDILASLGDKMGQAAMLHLKSEMMRAQGDKVGATVEAEKALKMFVDIKCKGGEEQATETISSLLVERGFTEKAPMRKDALKALRNMCMVIEKRDATQLPIAEAEVVKKSHLLVDQDYADVLHPMLHADPGAITFLEGQGWTFNKKAGSEGFTKIRQFPHRAFYLQMCMTGMGFGPQFRGVNPYCADSTTFKNKGESKVGFSISQLPETEDWQQDALCYRPGLLDASLQSTGLTTMFPPLFDKHEKSM